MARLTPKMQKLLALLRRIETERLALPDRDFEALAIAEAGYKEIKTYRSKYLDGKLLFHVDEDKTIVQGANAISDDQFAALLSQRKGDPIAPSFATEDEWRRAMEALEAIGRERGYKLKPQRGLFDS